MDLTQEEALPWQQLLKSAFDGNLDLMIAWAASLDHGEGLVELYTNYRGPNGTTALHWGAFGGRTEICKYLIEDVGLDVNIQEPRGETVLNLAISGLHHQTVAYLITKGANVNLVNREGMAALHHAARKGLTESLQLLISSGADIEASSDIGTPLQWAASQGKSETLKILLDNKADPNAMPVHMYTPLMLSVVAQSHKCVNLLLKAGAEPDLGGGGMTPLEMAAYQGYNEIIQCLLEAGASPNITNREGITPLEVAVLRLTEGAKILWPMTSPVPSIPDWTIGGLVTAVGSEEARKQREQKRKDSFMEAKSKGAEAFKKKDYLEAISWYNRANTCDPEEETVLSNRSFCWAYLNNGTRALADAEACIALKPDWAKAHYRKGVTCELLEDFARAEKAYELALKLQPGNDEIQTALVNVRAIQLRGYGCWLRRKQEMVGNWNTEKHEIHPHFD